MTQYATGNPLGSTDPRDLFDNAQNLDNLLNGDLQFYADRLGKQRISVRGMNEQYDSIMEGFNASFQQFLSNSGFEDIGAYAAGKTITRLSQTFTYNNLAYRPKSTLTLPYTLTGNWDAEKDNFLLIGDSSLRQDLSNGTDPLKGISAIAGSIRVVDSVAALKALPAAGSKSALVLGYWGAGTDGGGIFTQVASGTADNGSIIQGTDGTKWARPATGTVSTAQFGARRDGTTDDTAAVANAFAYLLKTGAEMIIDYGNHKITSAMTWDFTTIASRGCRIRGRAANACILDFSSVPAAQGTPFQWIAQGNTALFYMEFESFNIRTVYNGIGFRIGKDDLTDAWNECVFHMITVNNGSQTANNVSCALNHVLHSKLHIIANAGGSGNPESQFSPGYGTAMQWRQVIGCWGYINACNGYRGLYITGGYSYGNYIQPDIEEVHDNLTIDSPNCTRNTFLGGMWVGVNIINATAGSGNILLNINISLYAGGVIKVNMVGIFFDVPGQYDVATPSMPASGTAVKNNTGRVVRIYIGGGTVSAITISQKGGGTAGVPLGSWSNASIDLLPEESITITYSAAPSWLWRPAK